MGNSMFAASKTWYPVTCKKCKEEKKYTLAVIRNIKKWNNGDFICKECRQQGRVEVQEALLAIQKKKMSMKKRRRT